MSTRRTSSPTLFLFGFTSSSQATSRPSPKVSKLVFDLTDTMSHKVEVLLYLNVARTIRTSIQLLEICETEAKGFTVSTPYTLRTEWRTLITQRVIEDIIYDHRALDALTDALLVQDKFRILRHNGAGVQDNCNRQSQFKQRLTTSVAANKTFCVEIHLHSPVIESLRLEPKKN
jgi:hypothetical protein